MRLQADPMAAKPEETLSYPDVMVLVASILDKWGDALPDKKACPLARLSKLSSNRGCGPGPCRRPCCRPLLTVIRYDLTVDQRRQLLDRVRDMLVAFDLRAAGQARLVLSCRTDARNALLQLLDRLIICFQRGGQSGQGPHSGPFFSC